MTTQSWSTVIDHTGDAGFRAWVAEFIAKLIAAGLVQTADTGQINTATVTRPGTSTDGGYAIFRMNDTQQGTAPVFLRFNFGTNTSANAPRIQLQTGTSSNGSGTLGGTTTSALSICSTAVPISTVTAFQSYACVNEGFVGLVFKAGGATASSGGLAVAGFVLNRSCDANGDPTADALFILRHNASGTNAPAGTNQSVRLAATAAVYTSSTNPACMVPGAEVSSLVGANTQAAVFFMISRQVAPVFGICAAYLTEAAAGTTFSTTLVGSTPRTYLNVGPQLGVHWNAQTLALHGLCFLWE